MAYPKLDPYIKNLKNNVFSFLIGGYSAVENIIDSFDLRCIAQDCLTALVRNSKSGYWYEVDEDASVTLWDDTRSAQEISITINTNKSDNPVEVEFTVVSGDPDNREYYGYVVRLDRLVELVRQHPEVLIDGSYIPSR